MANFITNSGVENLKDRISELISKSNELKFLVGFFYFSGIKELYERLKNNNSVKLKILVGLNVDKITYGFIELAERDSNISDQEKIDLFFKSLEISINSDDFDKREFYEQVKFFINLIKEDRLIIRKTYRPNHAKLYIFKLRPGEVKNTIFITGSSNLTSAGLKQQEEFNVEISDYGSKEAEEYFDNLWEEAIRITENNVIKERLINTIENKTLIKKITPFEAYALVLKNYLETFSIKDVGDESIKSVMEKNGFTPYLYQIHAVKQVLSIIENNNGVIIADVVGLGKTIISCLIVRQLRKRGIVLCPPGLIGDEKKEKSGWKWYLETFGLYDWRVESIGKLGDQDFIKSLKGLKDIEVIIVDEAHRFRNEDTKSYEQLKNLCRDKIVILLTATPFNNRPGDILSLLKLFISPRKSTITLENNLIDKFRIFKATFDKLGYIKKYHNSADEKKSSKVKAYYKSLFGEDEIDLRKVTQRAKYLSKQIRDVIEPVTIRRNRLDLQKNPFYSDEVKNLTEVADPQEWFFELSKEQSKFYDEVISYFNYPEEGGKFKGAIYRPFEYKAGLKYEDTEIDLSEEDNRRFQQQFNLYDFMRRLLVKRFESSFGAFKQSIENFRNVTDHCLQFINKTNKFILDRDLLEKIYGLDPDQIEDELREYAQKIKEGVYPKNYDIYEIEKFKEKDRFLEDIESDLNLFEGILKRLDDLELVNNDPKLKRLINNLEEWRKTDPLRKIVIFSEYLDTVKYLEKPLQRHFNNRVLVIASDLTKTKIEEINKNFDASYPEEKKEDKYDIILSTDRISEGFNLNRAGLVINYDIPWNPVRVIQRVGRINRIGKKVFDKVYIANFFPTEKGSELVKSREIAAQKMFLIHNVLGEDAKIFDVDEEPIASELYQRIQQNPDKIESESFYTKVLNEFERIKKEYPEIIENIKNCPPRVKVAKKSDKDELIVFIKKRRLYIQKIDYNDQSKPQPVILEEIIDRIRCQKNEKLIDLSENFWEKYEIVKELREEKLPIPEASLEQKALNNIKTLLNSNNQKLSPLKEFLRTLREDIIDYGTLSDYTLRRIIKLKASDNEIENTIKELENLKNELGGENYLLKEKERLKEISKEIIIAIENRNL
jgi:superfamily II DNA or RNA helicase/HKD family nuclease